MDEHRIDAAVHQEVAHVPLMVLALGIEYSRDLQHLLGEVDEGQSEMCFEVHGVVAATAAQFQHLTYGYRG